MKVPPAWCRRALLYFLLVIGCSVSVCRRRITYLNGRGEASTDVHELLDIAVERATRDSWRFLGARSQAEARSYFASSMRRAWGVAFVREMARHRVSRLCYVGTTRRAGARAARAQAAGRLATWAMRSHSEFAAYAARAGGARAAGPAARWPRGG